MQEKEKGLNRTFSLLEHQVDTHTHTRTHAHTHTHTHTHTQGTGKSLTSSEVANQTGLAHIDVGTLAKEHDLFEGWDEQFQCPILDEDKVTIKLFYV